MNAPITIVNFVRAMFGRATNGRMIAVLAAFFDDSGTHSSSPVVVVGGLLGTEGQWAAFDTRWTKLLERPLDNKPRLTQFHLSPCQAGRGEFRNYTTVERDHITHLFNKIILDVGLVTFSCAVNKIAWDQLVVGNVAIQLGKPEGLCFVKCLEFVIKTIRIRKPGQRVSIIFDQGIIDRIEDLAKLYLLQSEIFPELAGIGYGKVAEIPPLQGADMIATGSYQFAQESLKDRDNVVAKEFFRSYLKREQSLGILIDREQIEEMVVRVIESLARSNS